MTEIDYCKVDIDTFYIKPKCLKPECFEPKCLKQIFIRVSSYFYYFIRLLDINKLTYSKSFVDLVRVINTQLPNEI